MKIKKNLNLSLIGLDKILTQALNVIYYLIIARMISKEAMGVYNWIIAITTTVGLIFTFGISPIIVRKIAGNKNNYIAILNSVFSYFIFLLFILIAVCIAYLLIFNYNYLFSLFALAFFQVFLSNLNLPFTQVLQGLENYKILAINNIVGICIKTSAGILGLIYFRNVETLLIALILANTLTLILLIYYFKKYLAYKYFMTRLNFLLGLLRESMPMLGMIIFNTALARFDWIFIGLLKTKEITAEYTFAYKIYEMTWLPHVILTTFLIPTFSKGSSIPKSSLTYWYKGVVYSSMFIPFIMMMIWTPFMEKLTLSKYGASNELIFQIFCFSVPFSAAISFLWNWAISQRKDKAIFFITILTTICNITLNIFLIQYSSGIGAATTTLLTSIFQFILYCLLLRKSLIINYYYVLYCSLLLFISIQLLQIFRYNIYFSTFIVFILIITYLFGFLKIRTFFSFIPKSNE